MGGNECCPKVNALHLWRAGYRQSEFSISVESNSSPKTHTASGFVRVPGIFPLSVRSSLTLTAQRLPSSRLLSRKHILITVFCPSVPAVSPLGSRARWPRLAGNVAQHGRSPLWCHFPFLSGYSQHSTASSRELWELRAGSLAPSQERRGWCEGMRWFFSTGWLICCKKQTRSHIHAHAYTRGQQGYRQSGNRAANDTRMSNGATVHCLSLCWLWMCFHIWSSDFFQMQWDNLQIGKHRPLPFWLSQWETLIGSSRELNQSPQPFFSLLF